MKDKRIEELAKDIGEIFGKISDTFISNAQYIYEIEARVKKLEERDEK